MLFVEGRTEKLAFPFIFRALGFDADQEAIAIVDCAGKGNMPLFAEICNACEIPYVVVHDRDAPRGTAPAEAEQIANDTIMRVAGASAPSRSSRTSKASPGCTPGAGSRRRPGSDSRAATCEVPGPLQQAVERVVAAAHRAPRTTRGA